MACRATVSTTCSTARASANLSHNTLRCAALMMPTEQAHLAGGLADPGRGCLRCGHLLLAGLVQVQQVHVALLSLQEELVRRLAVLRKLLTGLLVFLLRLIDSEARQLRSRVDVNKRQPVQDQRQTIMQQVNSLARSSTLGLAMSSRFSPF